MNFGEYEEFSTYRMAIYVGDNKVTYFDGFGVEHILK